MSSALLVSGVVIPRMLCPNVTYRSNAYLSRRLACGMLVDIVVGVVITGSTPEKCPVEVTEK